MQQIAGPWNQTQDDGIKDHSVYQLSDPAHFMLWFNHERHILIQNLIYKMAAAQDRTE